MPNDTFVMSSRQAAELDHALGRNGWTPEDVKLLSAGTTLADILQVLCGNAEIKYCEVFHETGELTIKIPTLPRPTLKEIQERFLGVRSIERDSSPTKELTLKLVTVLREGENSIGGKEYECRIAPKQDIVLGYQQAVWLEEHQDEFPEFMALLGKIYIDFSGLVVASGGGGRSVFCLGRRGGRWCLRCGWLGSDFGRGGRVASSCK